MKWYTLEERPLKEGEEGLAALSNDKYDIITREETDPPYYFGNLISTLRVDFNETVYYQEDEIVCWIPLDELRKTLPNGKECKCESTCGDEFNRHTYSCPKSHSPRPFEELKLTLPKDKE